MTSGVGGFQNPGVYRQAFPPFLPHFSAGGGWRVTGDQKKKNNMQEIEELIKIKVLFILRPEK